MSLLTVIIGRPWFASELRQKSFKDLHTLWYVCLREKNLLATQKEEVRRMGVTNSELQVSGEKVRNVCAYTLDSIY
jgi:large subunit ribosomal protein L47